MPSKFTDLAVTSLVFILLINLFNRFISMIFVMNFSTSGLNATVTFCLLFLLPVGIFPIIKERPLRYDAYQTSLIIFLAMCSLLTLISNAIIAATFAGLGLTFGCLYLLESTKNTTGLLTNSFSIAIIVNITLSIVFVGLTLYSIPYRLWAVSVISLLLLIAQFQSYRIRLLDEERQNSKQRELSVQSDQVEDSDNLASAGSYQIYNYLTVLMALLFVSLFGANPFIVGAWSSDASTDQLLLFLVSQNSVNQNITSGVLGIIAILGVIFGLYLTDTQYIGQNYATILFAISAIDLLFVQAFPLVMYIINIASLILLLGSIPFYPSSSIKALAVMTVFGLALAFLHTIAGHWAFLPGPLHPILQGAAPMYLFILGLTIPSISYIVKRRNSHE